MTKATRAQYTLEFKQEAVRLVESGQSIAAAARSLGVVEQTLYNWVKAKREERLISICSTLTALLLAAPFSRPSRFALTQLYNVCSTTPRLRAAAAMLWPDSTSRTASCLNSSVYCARVAFVISVSLLY